MSYPERTVVTGAGLAGFRTVEELRRRGYSGQLTLIGAEDWPPYDRPPLSKRVLTDGIDPSLNADFASLDVDFRPAETAIALEVPGAEGAIAIGQGSVWVTLPGFPITRIDPGTDRVVQQFYGEGGGAIQVGLNSVWLSNLKEKTLWRLDPKRIAATLAE